MLGYLPRRLLTLRRYQQLFALPAASVALRAAISDGEKSRRKIKQYIAHTSRSGESSAYQQRQ
jgi:hypothetical protein